MASAFETFRRLGPAAFVLKAIITVIVADALLLGFILLRRTYRNVGGGTQARTALWRGPFRPALFAYAPPSP